MASHTTRARMAALAAAAAILTVGSVAAQTRIKPGFNLFSVDQDKEVGKESAAKVEKELPILNDRAAEQYVNAIGKRLEAVAPGPEFDYRFKIVNTSDINAFALPGGYMYLNRGVIEAAGNEGELAGVMAHEMAHVALRHGTNQASKAYLGQTGLGIFGGLVAKDNRSTARTIGAVGGFGLNVLFLKFSRTDESQADIVGSQMLAKAGYDPMDMVRFFKKLVDKRGREPSKVEQFFSDHPEPGDRAARVREETKSLKVRPTAPVGGFEEVQASLKSMPPAKTMQQIARKDSSATTSNRTSTARADGTPVRIGDIESPSTQFRTFQQRRRFFTIEYPSNWRVYEPVNGYGVTIAPEGGFVDTGGEEKDLVYGVIVNHYDPFDDDDADSRFGEPTAGEGLLSGSERDARSQDSQVLAAATNDLLGEIMKSNPNLKIVPDSQRNDRINGAPALSIALSGRSSSTGEQERVTLFTRQLEDEHVIYALFIAPAADYEDIKLTFQRMVSSLRVNDAAVHE